MTRTTFKKIPFDIELAKKITYKEQKGRIVTRGGRPARIICFDRKSEGGAISEACIIALAQCESGYEVAYTYKSNGIIYFTDEFSALDLCLEVPTYYKDYTKFEPQKWQPCLVRDSEEGLWFLQVSTGVRIGDEFQVYVPDGSKTTWTYCLPLSKVTERLIGTNKSYEQLIQELDGNGQD